jgi:hypothetical protein
MFHRFRKHRDKPAAPTIKHVMQLGAGPDDWLRLEECYSNIFISGQVGSAKTTGVGALLARGLLRHPSKPGALVLCQKPDEAQRWIKYAEDCGRADDVMHVYLGGPHSIDLLDYELSAKGGGVESAGVLLDVILEVANRNRQRTSSDSYWPESSGRQMRYAMTLIRMAGYVCGLQEVLEFCQSLPADAEQLKDPAWKASSYAVNCLLAAAESHSRERAFQLAGDWLISEWSSLAEKTKSIISSVTNNTLDRFLSGPFADLICGNTTFSPEDPIERGRLLIFDLPGAVYGPPAQWASVAVKLLTQRALMRRDLTKPCRPVILWCDEAANFCVPEMDAMFLSQSRQFKAICVNIVQNLPLIITALGAAEAARHQAMAWLSNHATIFACANSDPETNHLMSSMCGETKEIMHGGSGGTDNNYNVFDDLMGTYRGHAHASWNETYRPSFPADRYSRLLRGGRDNDFIMEAVVFQSGRTFSNGKTWIKSAFRQVI